MQKNSEFDVIDFSDIIFDKKGNMTKFGALVSIFVCIAVLQAICKLKTTLKK